MKRFGLCLLTCLALTTLLLPAGCSDDPVTPHEQTELTAEDVAYQAGFIIFAMAQMLPNVDKVDGSLHSLSGFAGMYWKDGSHVWTDTDNFLSWQPEGYIIDIGVHFDITESGGLANGSGSLESGELDASFTLTDCDVPNPGSWPAEGTVVVASGGFTASATFDGTAVASVQIGLDTWDVDLTDGTIIEP